MNQKALRRFRIIGISTITAVYLLILIGAIVRASGAGMGCPDWPTCFGHWIPPTQESQLPPNYHEIYADLGYANTNFNPVKTWTEYFNRLAGVTIGILMILTTVFAFPFLKGGDKGIFYLSLTALLLVIFQGWLGAVVVSTNLHPLMITAHMLLALTIVALLIYAVARSQRDYFVKLNSHALNRTVYVGLWLILGMTLIQIILGAQVREAVDMIAKAHEYQNRYLWRQELPWVFYVHRAFAFIVLTANFWLIWQFLRTLPENHLLFRLSIVLGILVVLAVGAGISLERLGIPPFIQPIHLLLANLIFGAQFFLLVAFRYCRITEPETSSSEEISAHL
ncbi:MAG: cytochrome oxidase assembly protein [Methylothermaceae bacteria B42]|nr:MAG: cytochrome oxidase assembly protein [Methylothermaceae bacteria B42]HHJ39489.1 heme A synthase [Methylothermaceae bacterium]